MIDAKVFGAEVAAMVREYVGASVAPLAAANEALRAENAALAKRLEAVEARAVATPEDVEKAVSAIVIPAPADLSDVEKRIEDAVSRGDETAKALDERLKEVEARPVHDLTEIKAAIEAIEIPEVPVLPDIPAMIEEAVTAKTVSAEVVAQMVSETVSEAVAAIPPAKDGKDADPAVLVGLQKDIEALREKVAGLKIPEAIRGADGVGLASARINEDGELICKLTNGETLNAGRVIGRDGLGFDDFELEYDGERTFTARFKSGEAVKEYQHKLPIPIDRGVYKEDADYERGDGVTWAGSYWLAQKDAPEGKPEQSKDWRLSIKRGRDGKSVVKP